MSTHQHPKNYEKDDVDFGSNFDKFATYAKPKQPGNDDINDFDFNAAIGSKEESKDGDFDFNFNAGQQQKKSPATNDPLDLMDMLGGDNQPQQNPADIVARLAAAGNNSIANQFGAQPIPQQQMQ